MTSGIAQLTAFATSSSEVNAIVDTPQGSQNKFKYDVAAGLFFLRAAMPAGATFPFEFGFIPTTITDDGDPLDILILLDAPTVVGCLIRNRLIGVLLAEQSEQGKEPVRNDRLIGVAVQSRRHKSIKQLRDLTPQLLAEIEHFFVSYNAIKGKRFKPLGRHGPAKALALVRQAVAKAALQSPR